MLRVVLALFLCASACKGADAPPAYAGPVAGSKAAPQVSLDPAAAMAVVNGTTISAKEVDDAVKARIDKMESDYIDQIYQLRRQALEGLISQKLTEAMAKKEGIAAEDLFRREVEQRVKSPTEAELKAFYTERQAQIPYPFEQVKDRLKEHLMNETRQTAAKEYLDSLRAKAKVQVLLVAPEKPRIKVAAEGPAKGPATAPITIVEFSDFQCPFCSRVNPTIERVMAEYKGKVRLVFRDYPLSFHEDAPKAAEAAHCADAQGKFWQMHDKLFASQQQGLKAPELKRYAKEIGLDGAKFDACLDSGQFAPKVARNTQDAEAAGVNGTPAFFVNGVLLSGAQPFEQFKEIIDRELQTVAKN